MNYFKTGTAAFVMAAAMMTSSAFAQVDAEAKALLNQSADAIKALKGMSYTAKLYGLGALKPIMDGEGEVKQIRSTTDPRFSALWIKGTVAEIGKGKTAVFVTGTPRTIRWQDDPQNTVFERPVTDRVDATRILGLGSQILMAEFKEVSPYTTILSAPKLEIRGEEAVHGENCKVVVASFDSVRSVTTWISTNDKLPRKVEMAHLEANADPDKRIAKGTEIWNFKPLPDLKESDLAIPVPAGYKEDKQEAPAKTAQPADPQNPTNSSAPTPDPVLGLPVGSDAPEFDLKDVTGKSAKLSSLKGDVTVVVFAGSRFPKSAQAGDVVQSVVDAYKGKNVKFFAVTCREENDQAAKGFAAAHKWSFPVLTGGDALCTPYRVVGFPSTYVIGADGKVSKFFQGVVSKDELNSAIQAATAAAAK